MRVRQLKRQRSYRLRNTNWSSQCLKNLIHLYKKYTETQRDCAELQEYMHNISISFTTYTWYKHDSWSIGFNITILCIKLWLTVLLLSHKPTIFFSSTHDGTNLTILEIFFLIIYLFMCVLIVFGFNFQLHVVLVMNYCSNSSLWTEETTRATNTLAFACPNWPHVVWTHKMHGQNHHKALVHESSM